MREWAKSRRAGLLGWSLALFVSLVPLLALHSTELPSVIGGGVARLRWVTLLPLPIAVALAQSLEPRKRPQELSSARRIGLWDGGLVLSVMTLMLAALTIVDVTLSRIPGVAFRNSLLIPILTVLLAARMSAPAAGGVITALIVVSQSYAPYAPHSGWVRLFQSEGNPGVSTCLIVAASAVLCLAFVRGQRLTSGSSYARSGSS